MPDRVHITDVAPRDGLQNERGFVPTPEKVRLVGLLADAGVDAVEVTSFVSPKWIPQLADAEEVFERVLELFASRDTAPAISALVPNEKGLDRATRFHTPDRPLQIGLFTAASETFCARNVNASIDETIERFQAVVPRALDQGMRIRCYISCAVACPFEGAVAPRAVRAVADKCIALAPEAFADGRAELDLADTIGAATPGDIETLLDEFSESEIAGLVLHLHDTLGHAADCAARGLALGVRKFDSAAGGLGGCPYASTKQKRAPGNIDTAQLVRRILDEGFETGVDTDALEKAAMFARQARDNAGQEAHE